MKQPDTKTTAGKISVMQAFERFGRRQITDGANWFNSQIGNWNWIFQDYRIHPEDLATMEREEQEKEVARTLAKSTVQYRPEPEADPYWQLKQWFAEDWCIDAYSVANLDWFRCTNPDWQSPLSFYRRAQKPEPQWWTQEDVPQWWTQEDVPPVCWIRFKTSPTAFRKVVEIHPHGIVFGNAYFKTFRLLAAECEHSTDRKIWKDCTK